LNLLLNLKTERDFFSENRVGEKALFFVHVVEAEKSTGLGVKDIVVGGADIPSMISRIDGLIGLIYPTRSGSGL